MPIHCLNNHFYEDLIHYSDVIFHILVCNSGYVVLMGVFISLNSLANMVIDSNPIDFELFVYLTWYYIECAKTILVSCVCVLTISVVYELRSCFSLKVTNVAQLLELTCIPKDQLSMCYLHHKFHGKLLKSCPFMFMYIGCRLVKEVERGCLFPNSYRTLHATW